MYLENYKKIAKENTNFRTVLQTGTHAQIVAMSLIVGEEIGEETHENIDQLFFCISGEGEAVLNSETKKFEKHDMIFVPAKTKHNLKNMGDGELKLITIYSPPAHADGTIHKTKADAMNEGH